MEAGAGEEGEGKVEGVPRRVLLKGKVMSPGDGVEGETEAAEVMDGEEAAALVEGAEEGGGASRHPLCILLAFNDLGMCSSDYMRVA